MLPSSPEPYWLRHPNYPVTPIPPRSGYAMAALWLGIFGLLGAWCLFGLPCLLAIICGHIGYAETKNGRRSGREAAFWGLFLGYLVLVPALILGTIFVLSSLSG